MGRGIPCRTESAALRVVRGDSWSFESMGPCCRLAPTIVIIARRRVVASTDHVLLKTLKSANDLSSFRRKLLAIQRYSSVVFRNYLCRACCSAQLRVSTIAPSRSDHP